MGVNKIEFYVTN